MTADYLVKKGEIKFAILLDICNEILRLIKDFTRKGKSVIITSHEMSEITFCDSLYGIRDGCTVTLDKEINGFELTEWIQG